MSYVQQFLKLLQEYSDLRAEQRAVDEKLARLTPMIQTTYNALDPLQRAAVASPIAQVEWKMEGLGMRQAVLMALDANAGDWLTPPEVRDYMEANPRVGLFPKSKPIVSM